MSLGKATSLPFSGSPERFFTWVGSCFTQQTLYYPWKACKGETLLLRKFVTYGRKKFYNIDLRGLSAAYAECCYSECRYAESRGAFCSIKYKKNSDILIKQAS